MPGTPITIVLYGPEDEAKKTYSRSVIPWGILKKAIVLTKLIDESNVTENDIDAIASLIVEVFGNQFSIVDLDAGADVGEMLAAVQAIVSRASALVKTNPTIPPRRQKKK